MGKNVVIMHCLGSVFYCKASTEKYNLDVKTLKMFLIISGHIYQEQNHSNKKTC